MAIYHFSAKIISRSQGRSATAAAAYRSGEKIVDEQTELVHDYSRKKGVSFCEVMTPDSSPDWMKNRAQLWNAVEKAEKRKDAQLCREVEVALPCEMTLEQMKECLRGFCKKNFVDQGMIADINIHHADSENPHAHILLTMRDIEKEGFGNKNREWNKKENLEMWRKNWGDHVNENMKKLGLESRIDHRTLQEQGIERIAQIHIGAKVAEMEARGIQTERGQKALDIDLRNEQIQELIEQRRVLENEYHHTVKASKERGTDGARDRTFSSGFSQSWGRDTGFDARTATDEQAVFSRVAATTERSQRSMERSRFTDELSSQEVDSSWRQSRQESEPYFSKNDVLDDVNGSHYGSSLSRVIALSATYKQGGSQSTGARLQAGDTLSSSQREGQETVQQADGLDRSVIAVRHQLAGMGCECYEIGIRDKQGRMMRREWTADEVLKSIAWLKRENAKGADIYIRPAGERNQGLILIDDLNQGQIRSMKEQGVEPSVLIETSPFNHQAWIKVSKSTIEPEVATFIAKELAQQFQADRNSADWKHFGRLAGFTNRKPQHQTQSGRNPWVLCKEYLGKVASGAEKLLERAKAAVSQFKADMETNIRLESLKTTLESTNGSRAMAEYQKSFKSILEHFRGLSEDLDFSRADFAICKKMAQSGFSPKVIEQVLEQASPELPQRKAGHQSDYCKRTVNAAFNSHEVQQFFEQQRDRTRSRELSR